MGAKSLRGRASPFGVPSASLRLLGLLAARQTPDQILRAHPYLEAADIHEALRYAASLAEDETIEFGG